MYETVLVILLVYVDSVTYYNLQPKTIHNPRYDKESNSTLQVSSLIIKQILVKSLSYIQSSDAAKVRQHLLNA